MEIWSNGTDLVVYDDAGLTYFSGEEITDVSTLTGDPAALGPRKGFKSSKHRIFAVNIEQRTAVVGEPGEVPYYIDLERKAAPQRMSFRWIAAAHLKERDYFAVLPEDDRFQYEIVRLNSSGQVVDESVLSFPVPHLAETQEITWKRWKERKHIAADAPLPESVPAPRGPFTIQRNRFGTAICDAGTGTVSVVRPGSTNIEFCLLFPCSGDETFLACATAGGVAVSASLSEKHSSLCLFSSTGEKIGERSKFEREYAWGGGVPFMLEEGQLAWPHSTNGGTLSELSLPALDSIKESKIAGGTAFFDQVFEVTPQHFFLSSRSTLLELRRNQEGLWEGAVRERKAIPKKARQLAAALSGAPLLQIRAFSEHWKAPLGKLSSIGFELSNMGGEARGLSLEVSGDALERGFVVPKRMTAGAGTANFEKTEGGLYKAELPDLPLGAAHEKGTKRSKVEPFVLPELRIILEGASAGGGFLLVRAKTSGGATSAVGKALQVVS